MNQDVIQTSRVNAAGEKEVESERERERVSVCEIEKQRGRTDKEQIYY